MTSAVERNPDVVRCSNCRCRIFSTGAAELVKEPLSLPVNPPGGLNPGFMEWWVVHDKMHFDNIAFLKNSKATCEVTIRKEPDEPLGTMFEDDDDLNLREVFEGSAAEKAGVGEYVGWTATHVNGKPVPHCDVIRGESKGATEVTLSFHPPPESNALVKLLVCADCERDVIGFADGKGRYLIACKLVELGGARPNLALDPSDPQAASLLQSMQAQQQQPTPSPNP